MTFIMMAAEMRLKINLPVGDLSHLWPRTDVEMGRAERDEEAHHHSHHAAKKE